MSKHLYRELKAVMCGALIGEGIGRRVFECRHDPRYVVKIELRTRSFQNVAEWEAWEWLRCTKKADWLAPCLSISPSGTFLLQQRVTPLRPKEFPKRIPAFLTDIKRENFGWLEGRVVCIDYGTILSNIEKASDRLVKANWK